MLDDFIKRYALQLLMGAIRPDVPEQAWRQFAEAFWQVTYMKRLGIVQPLLPNMQPPGPPPGGPPNQAFHSPPNQSQHRPPSPPPGGPAHGGPGGHPHSRPAPPNEGSRMQEEALMEIINLYTDSTIPEARLQNVLQGNNAIPEARLQSVLQDNSIRLTAAKNLAQKLENALQQLNQEIAYLEQKV